ncbi:MAG: hypothetical protein AAF990_07670 [Bacteroidota bacterium]
MKLKYFFIFLASLFWGTPYMSAQAVADIPTMSLHSQVTSSGLVQLRWATNGYDTWQESITQGFIIERLTVSANGTPLSGTQMFQSKVTLETNYLPLPESQWAIDFPSNEFADVAKGTLYEPDTTTILSGPPKLVDALTLEESNEARFLFVHFASEQDFDVAVAAALGYEDPSAQMNHEYVYTVRLNTTDPTYEFVIGSVPVNTADPTYLPPLTELTATGMDGVIMLEWEIASTRLLYSSYDIERDDGSGVFVKVNEQPFVFATDREKEPTHAIYLDSIPANGVDYTYQVRGRSAFGNRGEASNKIIAQGVPSRMEFFFAEFDVYKHEGSRVKLKWPNLFSEPGISNIVGFNIFRSQRSSSGFAKINATMLPGNTKRYFDTAPLPTAYYRLQAVDVNGYEYLSGAVMVQEVDTVPPVPPVGLNGTFTLSSIAELSWQANQEDDLDGYKVYVSDSRDGEYTQATDYKIEKPEYIHEIDPGFVVDSIFFKLCAIDKNDNYSDLSPAFGMERPDVVGPSRPNLFKARPTPAGIRIGFRFSSSKDRSRHEFQRKPRNAPGWQTIEKVDVSEEDAFLQILLQNNPTDSCYVDTTILERREYDYRLVAYDDQDNVSSSQILHIRPYDSGRRGAVSNVSVRTVCTPVGQIPQQEAYDILERIFEDYDANGTVNSDSLQLLTFHQIITATEYNDLIQLRDYEIIEFLEVRKMEVWGTNVVATIELDWDYSEETDLEDFQIFRSAEGSAVMLYKTLPRAQLNSFLFVDEDVRPGGRYVYQLMARHRGGGFSDLSKAVIVQVP